MNQAYEVKLDIFEGPLDLLLHLIHKFEIDIYDIPVAKITEQYMHYIHQMQQLELNIAGEYLVMAATLLAIKSKMLLPKQELQTEETEFHEDPRDELMERLIEYQKFKEAALELKEKEGQAVYTRNPIPAPERPEKQPEPAVQDGDLYDLIGALGRMLERKNWEKPSFAKVSRSEVPIRQCMQDIVRKLEAAPEGLLFDALFDHPSKSHIVSTFLALLELMKEQTIRCEQKQQLDALRIFKK